MSNTQLKSFGVNIFLKKLHRPDLEKWNHEYAQSIKLNSVYQNDFLVNYPNAIIASASFSEYLKPLFPSNIIIAAQLSYDSEGSVKGLLHNCYGIEKVKALQQININKIDVFFTDSFADKPLMDISTDIFLVKKGITQELAEELDLSEWVALASAVGVPRG